MNGNDHEVKTMYGARLAELRQAANLSVENIANKLRIRKSIISDIEAGEISTIPVVFLRGYIKSYAGIVNLPEDELTEFLKLVKNTERIPMAMKNYSQKEQQKRHGKRLVIWSMVILAIVVIVSGFFLWQEYRNSQTNVTHYTPSQRIMQELVSG